MYWTTTDDKQRLADYAIFLIFLDAPQRPRPDFSCIRTPMGDSEACKRKRLASCLLHAKIRKVCNK